MTAYFCRCLRYAALYLVQIGLVLPALLGVAVLMAGAVTVALLAVAVVLGALSLAFAVFVALAIVVNALMAKGQKKKDKPA